MTLIEANAKLINAGFSRIGDNLYVKGVTEFSLDEITMHDLPIETTGVVKFETTAWASSDYAMSSIIRHGMSGDNLAFASHDMSASGWIKVGTAVVTVTPSTHDDMVLANIDTLQKQIQAVQADAQIKVTELQGKIQNLMAITYDKQD